MRSTEEHMSKAREHLNSAFERIEELERDAQIVSELLNTLRAQAEAERAYLTELEARAKQEAQDAAEEKVKAEEGHNGNV